MADFLKHIVPLDHIPVLFDVDEPDGLVLHLRLPSRSRRKFLVKKHTKRGGELDNFSYSDELMREACIGFEGLTPKWLGDHAPHVFTPEAVRAMEAELQLEGETGYAFSPERLAQLLEHVSSFSVRLSELLDAENGAQRVQEAAEAHRKKT